jgi:cytosine/adenosine deaminase-related metal-dependent hydrolase
MSHDLYIANARPMKPDSLNDIGPATRDPVNIAIVDGVIDEVGPDVTRPDDDTPAVNGGGALVFPGFVDAHTHIDKTLLGMPWHRHEVGPTLMDKIVSERELVKHLDLDSHQQSMEQVRRSLANGTTSLRTFSDINTEWGLDGFHGLLQTRETIGDLMDLQIVVFPQSGMLIRPGTVELMDEAMREGSDVVGGLDPCSVDRDPAGHVDAIFALADKHDADIDIHLHEPGELGAFSLDLIIERTRVLGWQGRVVISHAICLGSVDDARLRGLVDQLVDLDIAIMTHGPGGHRAIPDVKLMRSLGLRVCSGNDGVRDAWGPLNTPDMLQRAYILAYRNNLRRDDDIEELIRIITTGSANVIGLPKHGIENGARADLVLVDAETHVEAVINHPPRKAVIKSGRVVAKNGELVEGIL